MDSNIRSDSNIRYPYKGEGSQGFQRFRDTCSHNELVTLYLSMLRIRRIEEEIERRYHQDFMKTPIHLVIGQEAAPGGSADEALLIDAEALAQEAMSL